MGIMGPAQPYLAVMVGVPSDQINFIWTLRAFGSCAATVLTGIIFKSFVKTRNLKLSFLSVCVLLIGVFIGLVPWISTFFLLLMTIMIAGIFLGCLDTASNSLVIFMLGPERSPPFTQSLHAMVALGFMLGSLLVTPFLPGDQKADHGKVCNIAANNDTGAVSGGNYTLDLAEADKLPNLIWPFTIIAAINVFCALSYLCLVIFGIPMPIYTAISQEEPLKGASTNHENIRKQNSRIIYFLSFFYFAFSCGMEGFFQSQTFTFGICGPHLLSPKEAAVLTTVYFSFFLLGRFSGIFVSSRVKPQWIIVASLISCVVFSLILVSSAHQIIEILYLATGAIGFSLSLQFPSGYSWLSEQVDLTGRGSSVVFLGANFGWLVFPPIAGMVFFSSVGPMGVFYLTLALSSSHLVLFCSLIYFSKIN